MATPQELPVVENHEEASAPGEGQASVADGGTEAVAPAAAPADRDPAPPEPTEPAAQPVPAQQAPVANASSVAELNGDPATRVNASSVGPEPAAPSPPTQQLASAYAQTTNSSGQAANPAIHATPSTVANAPTPTQAAVAALLPAQLQPEVKVAVSEAVTPTRKPRMRRGDVTRREDIAILRAIASVKPHDAEWGHVNRRWQRVADVVMEETGCKDMSPMLCRSRHKHLVSWFNPNRTMTFTDPLDEELYSLTAVAVEDMKKRELDANITRADLRTAFALMSGDSAPKTFQELYDAVVKAARAGDTQATEGHDQRQDAGDSKEAFATALDTPKRSREVLEGTITPRYATPFKRRKIEPRGVSETEFGELKRDVGLIKAKVEGQVSLQHEVEELKLAQAQRLEATEAVRTEVAELKTAMAGAVEVMGGLESLRVLINEQQSQTKLMKNELNAEVETVKQANEDRSQKLEAQCEAQRSQVEQLQSALDAETERVRRLEELVAQVQKECETRDFDRMAVMDSKTALLEKTVADFEAIVQKQQELMEVYNQSLDPPLMATVNRSREAAKELASLRATIDAERAERTRGQAQLLDILHQIFAKENSRLV